MIRDIKPAVVAAAILAQPAVAQTAPDRLPWSGPYFGATLGFGEAVIVPPAGASGEVEGRITSIHSGFSWRRGQNVFGIEGDLTVNIGRDTAFGPKQEIAGVETGVDWLATLRLRYGRIVEDTMVFVTAGGAYSDTVSTDRSYAFGAAAGGGVEVALGERWTVRSELLWMDFGEGDDTLAQTDSTWLVQFGLSRYW